MNTETEDLMSDAEAENLNQLFATKIDSDEDYRKLGEIFDEDE
jgi:hypothetical protein